MRKLLLVIDMQRDFVDGALGTPEAVKIVPNVVRKIKAYPREDVIATRDTHGADYLQTQEGQKLPVVHCVRGTPEWELVPEVAEALGDAQIVDKPTFGSVALAQQIAALAEQEPVAIELVGLCTDYLCGVQRAPAESDDAGGPYLGGSDLLCRCDGGASSHGAGDYGELSNYGGGNLIKIWHFSEKRLYSIREVCYTQNYDNFINGFCESCGQNHSPFWLINQGGI